MPAFLHPLVTKNQMTKVYVIVVAAIQKKKWGPGLYSFQTVTTTNVFVIWLVTD
jgi:hypothetical protein